MSSQNVPLKMLFFPLMAPGHMLPMVDMAKLFSTRGVSVFIISTPLNIPAISVSVSEHPNLSILTIPFPAIPALPPTCQNISSLPSPDLEATFISSLSSLEPIFRDILGNVVPDVVVTDMFLPWTCKVAEAFSIPRLVFHGQCFFSLCVNNCLQGSNKLVENEEESFLVPGLPHRIRMLKTQLPDYKNSDPTFVQIFEAMKEADAKSYGVVVNSFYELEPDYAEYYRNVVGKKCWHVGPVRGINEDNNNQEGYIGWLNSQPVGSVVYVCFGSISFFSDAEMRTIELGLDSSGYKYIWVVRSKESRVSFTERGVVIRGWGPQIMILNHVAVGGFLTHCGWNSCLEGISAGLAMVTWPLCADQFKNERLIVDVLRIGVAVGSKKYAMKPEERGIVEKEKIASAVERVMGSGEDAVERRRRAKELGEAARRAVDISGSSYEDVGNLIAEFVAK